MRLWWGGENDTWRHMRRTSVEMEEVVVGVVEVGEAVEVVEVVWWRQWR